MVLGAIERVNEYTPFVRVFDDVRDIPSGELKRLMDAHGVLIFPNQTLSPEDELRVTKAFGYHVDDEDSFEDEADTSNEEDPQTILPCQPAVQVVGNIDVDDESLHLQREGFLADGIHERQDNPPVLTAMYCREMVRGETLFACTRTAFANLPKETKEYIRKLSVHYLNNTHMVTRGTPVMRDGVRRLYRENDEKLYMKGYEDLDHPIRAVGGTVHPLVRTHSETGDESIWVNCGQLCYMEADATDTEPCIFLDTLQCYDLLEEIIGDSTKSPNVYSHHWEVGDLIIWDNRVTLHSEEANDRLMHRVRLDGSCEANRDLVGKPDAEVAPSTVDTMGARGFSQGQLIEA